MMFNVLIALPRFRITFDIFGIGVDIVDLDRIKKIYSRYGDKFAYKILNNKEIKSYNLSKNKPSFLAKFNEKFKH